MELLKTLKTATSRLAKFMEYIGWAILLWWIFIMSAGTIMRYIFRSPLLFQADSVSMTLVVFCTFCFASAFLNGDHIRVDLITRFLPKRVQDFLWLLAEFVMSIYSLVMVISAVGLISHSIEVNAKLDISGIPLFPFQMCIPLGFGFLAIVVSIDFCERFYLFVKSFK